MQLVAVIETIDHPTKAHTLLLCGAEKRRLRSCVAARDLGCVCARTHAREDKKKSDSGAGAPHESKGRQTGAGGSTPTTGGEARSRHRCAITSQ